MAAATLAVLSEYGAVRVGITGRGGVGRINCVLAAPSVPITDEVQGFFGGLLPLIHRSSHFIPRASCFSTRFFHHIPRTSCLATRSSH